MPARTRPGGVDGRIAGKAARVWRGEDGFLRLDWRGRTFDLGREIVRHRDDDGAIEFRVGDEAARYRRKGPSKQDILWDRADFTADEPWTWEDSDFGLFVFHVATLTGPFKYRHRLDPAPVIEPSAAGGVTVTAEELARRRPSMREERVRWEELAEIRAKFEIAGIWSDMTLLTFDSGGGFAVVPLSGTHGPQVVAALRPHLRRLPGWSDGPLEVALEYATRHPQIGPRRGESIHDWAERPIWSRDGG